MSDKETYDLIMMWGRLAPNEPNGYDARCEEAKWEIENVYRISNFWSEDDWGQKSYGQQIHEDWEDRRK